jgi:hypothetical protein
VKLIVTFRKLAGIVIVHWASTKKGTLTGLAVPSTELLSSIEQYTSDKYMLQVHVNSEARQSWPEEFALLGLVHLFEASSD